ncbi:MAG: nicotinate (nicotinamide) nucleotide adenylyltransferase [Alistipes sp.]|nr:nicotinate (nicotinamide) nucleotide adenylyltransferase [Alistipes sp.]
MKRVFLYFGSFNPIHKGHISLAEYVVEQKLCDSVVLIVSPQNPHKDSSGLLPELTRFEMAEIACNASEYPNAIQASAIEFLLERPSYTINTLRYLKENNGHEMSFAVLMGADILRDFHLWREYEEILADYPIYVYPRKGYAADKYTDKINYLADAPVFDYSSTDIRSAFAEGRDTSGMLQKEVAEYIASHKLFGTGHKVAGRDDTVRDAAAHGGANIEEEIARGRAFFGRNEWGEALNAFRRALKLDPRNKEAAEYVKMIENILAFRYKDIYNP